MACGLELQLQGQRTMRCLSLLQLVACDPGLTPAAGAAGPPGTLDLLSNGIYKRHIQNSYITRRSNPFTNALATKVRGLDQASLLTRKYLNFPSSLHLISGSASYGRLSNLESYAISNILNQRSVGDFSPTN